MAYRNGRLIGLGYRPWVRSGDGTKRKKRDKPKVSLYSLSEERQRQDKHRPKGFQRMA
jgi:hypothetical protein